jgi:hypothetical protein
MIQKPYKKCGYSCPYRTQRKLNEAKELGAKIMETFKLTKRTKPRKEKDHFVLIYRREGAVHFCTK